MLHDNLRIFFNVFRLKRILLKSYDILLST